MNRREILELGGIGALGLFVSGCRHIPARPEPGYWGKLELHRSGLLELPTGFELLLVQQAGDVMNDGFSVPGQPDGMACFEAVDGSWILLRNHELSTKERMQNWSYNVLEVSDTLDAQPRFSADARGAVCRLVLDPGGLFRDFSGEQVRSHAVSRSHLVLAGTDTNCAGGVVEGGWVSCEESSAPGHGYAFLTLPGDDSLKAPRPIRSWGRFHREAVALDPDSGIVYMTEDRADGCFYRFVPEDSATSLGVGRLQALVIPDVPDTNAYAPTATAPMWPNGHTWKIRWIDIEDPQAQEETCRAQGAQAGATRFCRGEGLSLGRGGAWFSASTGGLAGGGQVFRYDPSRATLTLELEITDRTRLSCPDNLCMSPWGDLVMCEDNYQRTEQVTHQHIRGMRPDGSVYDIARNPMNEPDDAGPEFSGACFSPDGRVLFVNVQTPQHMTLAIRGPWPA